MEAMAGIMARIKEMTGIEVAPQSMSNEEYTRFKCDSYNNSVGNLNETDGFNCEKCKNKGYIAKPMLERNSWYEIHCECSCQRTRRAILRLMKSGLKNIIKDYTFNKYEAEEEWQRILKGKAIEYAKNPNNAWFFIGGQVGCVDADTEYFDGKQWKRIAEYDGGKVLQYNPDSKIASLTVPERYIRKEADVLYEIKTKRGSINQVLSSDHNFAYVTSKGHMQKKRFSEVMKLHNENVQGFYGKIETAFNFSGKGIELSDNDIRLMCAVMADGSFRKKLKLCIVNVKKQRKKDRMRMLLTGRDYKEYQKSNGYTEFRFYAPRREKEFSDYWYDCNNEQLRVIADEVFYWDGSQDEKGRKNFFSTIRKNADFVQFALSATGIRATVSEDKRRDRTCYVVRAVKNKSTVAMTSTGGKNKAEIVEYKPKDGKQYCFTVETGYLVLRRNGRIFITGNCGKTHLCTAVSGAFLKQGKNVRYMLWRDDVTKLKSNVTDAQAYEELVTSYKTADVLYIDDLFKNGKGNDGRVQPPTGADIQVAFEILNYRYNNKALITIISSERSINELVDIDEATASRISEMSFGKGFGFNVRPDKAKNHRLKNISDL